MIRIARKRRKLEEDSPKLQALTLVLQAGYLNYNDQIPIFLTNSEWHNRREDMYYWPASIDVTIDRPIRHLPSLLHRLECRVATTVDHFDYSCLDGMSITSFSEIIKNPYDFEDTKIIPLIPMQYYCVAFELGHFHHPSLLKNLDLSYGTMSFPRRLYAFRNLRHLSLRFFNSGLVDLRPLNKLKFANLTTNGRGLLLPQGLEHLTLDYDERYDFMAHPLPTSLEYLTLLRDGGDVKLNGLLHLQNLTYLDIAEQQSVNLAGIEHLRSMKTLCLDDVKNLTSENLRSISTLPHLRRIRIYHTGLSMDLVDEFLKLLSEQHGHKYIYEAGGVIRRLQA